MKKNILFKITLLTFGLVMIVWFQVQIGTEGFKSAVAAIFGGSNKAATLNWCADHVVDFAWVETALPEKILKLSMSDLRDDYCEVETEPIENVDLDQVKWTALAESSGATGKKALLEWNRELGLFKSGGMPFKSSKLAQELSL